MRASTVWRVERKGRGRHTGSAKVMHKWHRMLLKQLNPLQHVPMLLPMLYFGS